jgi:hypothetical protein
MMAYAGGPGAGGPGARLCRDEMYLPLLGAGAGLGRKTRDPDTIREGGKNQPWA